MRQARVFLCGFVLLLAACATPVGQSPSLSPAGAATASPSPSPTAAPSPSPTPAPFDLVFTGARNEEWSATSFARRCGAGTAPARYGDQTLLAMGENVGSTGDVEVDIVFNGIDFNAAGAIEIIAEGPSFSAPFGQQIEIDDGPHVVDRYFAQSGRITFEAASPNRIVRGTMDVTYTDPAGASIRIAGTWDCHYQG